MQNLWSSLKHVGSSFLTRNWTRAPCTGGEGSGTPLQYSCLEGPMDGGAWWAAVHGVVKSRTRLSNFTFTFHFHALEKEMATHSSVLAWRIPGTGEPGGLPSMGSHRVRHDWSDLAAAAPALGAETQALDHQGSPSTSFRVHLWVVSFLSLCQKLFSFAWFLITMPHLQALRPHFLSLYGR